MCLGNGRALYDLLRSQMLCEPPCSVHSVLRGPFHVQVGQLAAKQQQA